MRVWLAAALLIAPVLSAGTLEGRVIADTAPMPGCTVTLSGGKTRVTITDAAGRYVFLAVPPGPYTIEAEMIGMETETRIVTAGAEVTRVDDVEMRVAPSTEAITITCGMGECAEADPVTPYERPHCRDYDINAQLIASAGRGDRSAVELLRQRYKTTFSHFERHRIAGALLGKVDDDREYWNELSERAKEAIRFAYVDNQPTPELIRWCEAHDVEPEQHRVVTIRALQKVAHDRRARGLLSGALETSDPAVIDAALTAITWQHDQSFLPEIDQMLTRLPEHANALAMWLVQFRSDAADQVAMKYLSEANRAFYRKQRAADCATMGDCEAHETPVPPASDAPRTPGSGEAAGRAPSAARLHADVQQ